MRKFIIIIILPLIFFTPNSSNSFPVTFVPRLVTMAFNATGFKKLAYPIAAAALAYEGQKMYVVWEWIHNIDNSSPANYGHLGEYTSLASSCSPNSGFHQFASAGETGSAFIYNGKVYRLEKTESKLSVFSSNGKCAIGYGRVLGSAGTFWTYGYAGVNGSFYTYYRANLKLVTSVPEPEYDDYYAAKMVPESEISEIGEDVGIIDELEVRWNESLSQQVARITAALSQGLSEIGQAISAVKPDGITIEEILELVQSLPDTYDPYKNLPLTGPVPEVVIPEIPDIIIPDDVTVPSYPDGTVPVTIVNPPVYPDFPDSMDVVVTNTVPVSVDSAVEIADVSLPSLPSFDIPVLPDFDTSVELPEAPDWLSPVRDFLSSVMSSLPFVSMFSSAQITGNGSSLVEFTVLSHTFYFDFSDYEDFFVYVGTVLLFISSIKAVFIVVRGD